MAMDVKQEISVSNRSKLLCPTCGEVKRVKEITDQLLLVCGHTRPATTLPLDPKKVSYEQLIASRSGAAHRLFPVQRKNRNDLTEVD